MLILEFNIKMTLHLEEFKKCAKEFLSLSSSIDDGWSLKRTDKDVYYLEKRNTVHNSIAQNSKNSEVYNQEPENGFSVMVYHIIYSTSYSVPVLYFNAYHENGKLLSLDEIWNKIPKCYLSEIDKWSTITQQEHPILGIPYFMIHPCYTADFMKNHSTTNYLICWLSTVGPLAGLQLSLEYGKHI